MSITSITSLKLNRRLLIASGLLATPLLAPIRGGVAAQDESPSLEILSPASGDVITTDMIDVQVKINNFVVDCTQSGRPDEDGVGHIHVMVDGMTMANLTNFYCGDTFSVPGAGLAAGTHTLIVDLASNTHMDMAETAQQVEFDYQPANPIPLPEAEDLGEPGVTLVSPTDGADVTSVVSIEVDPVNFNPSEELEGKQNVPGYGHYHVFVDTPMGMMDSMDAMASPEVEMSGTPAEGHTDDMGGEMAMMSMAGMVLMPGANTFDLDLSAWGPGLHTIWIEPVQNDHTMFESFGHIEFTVVVGE